MKGKKTVYGMSKNLHKSGTFKMKDGSGKGSTIVTQEKGR